MGCKKPDPNKYILIEQDFELTKFRKHLAECIKWIYQDCLDQDERQFAFLAKRLLILLLDRAKKLDAPDDYALLRSKLLPYLRLRRYEILIDPRRKWDAHIAVFGTNTAIHAETLVSYVNNFSFISRYATAKFGRPALHDRCKRCKRIINVTRKRAAFCGKDCYRKYKGKEYYRKKAKAYHQRRKQQTASRLKGKEGRNDL